MGQLSRRSGHLSVDPVLRVPVAGLGMAAGGAGRRYHAAMPSPVGPHSSASRVVALVGTSAVALVCIVVFVENPPGPTVVACTVALLALGVASGWWPRGAAGGMAATLAGVTVAGVETPAAFISLVGPVVLAHRETRRTTLAAAIAFAVAHVAQLVLDDQLPSR